VAPAAHTITYGMYLPQLILEDNWDYLRDQLLSENDDTTMISAQLTLER
jgi:hypothetical protein